MTGKLWTALTLTACLLALIEGNGARSAAALMDSGTAAVNMTLELMGSMALWGGLMEQMHASGDIVRLGRWIRRAMQPIFPGVKDDEAWSAMGMNAAANLFGLGNAATPSGIRAAQLLARHGEEGLRALALMLALNNAGFQLMPTTVIAMRAAAGSAHPADIWLPTLACSGVAAAVAAALMLLTDRRK